MTGVNDDVPGGRELLRVEGVTKSFPGVRALDGVDLTLCAGEVHVLLGENGAGKSTLIKMLSGAHRPDEGRLLVDGEEVTVRSAQDAERLGIATIYQEFNLVPGLTVAENIFLGRQPRTRLGLVDKRPCGPGPPNCCGAYGSMSPRTPRSPNWASPASRWWRSPRRSVWTPVS